MKSEKASTGAERFMDNFVENLINKNQKDVMITSKGKVGKGMSCMALSPKELKKRLDALPNEEDLGILCFDCGEARYGRKPGCCTFYEAVCDLCKKKKMCTEVRDFRRGEKIK